MSHKTVAALLKKYKIHPNKKMGQHFLMDPNLMEKLSGCLELYPDEDVLEIGSGVGVLSFRIAKEALEVVGIEKDKRLITIASQEFLAQENLKFVQGDFLKLDLPQLLKNYQLPMKVIGNIPYNISSPILFKLLENRSLFQFAIVTLQKEVANRLTARVGTKDYGILTLLAGLHAQCERLFDIEPGAFIPPPKVRSTVIKMTFLKRPPFVVYNAELFKRIVKTAFQQRRKTIRNTLKKLLKNGRISPWGPCRINPKLRPEQLSLEQYVGLANYLNTVI